MMTSSTMRTSWPLAPPCVMEAVGMFVSRMSHDVHGFHSRVSGWKPSGACTVPASVMVNLCCPSSLILEGWSVWVTCVLHPTSSMQCAQFYEDGEEEFAEARTPCLVVLLSFVIAMVHF